MFKLDEECKRLTWRLANESHLKMRSIAKQTKLSQEEIINVMILAISNDDLKPALESFLRDKRKAEAAKKQATEAVSKLSTDNMNALSGLSEEQMTKLLNSLST
jgi:hypothetical protein